MVTYSLIYSADGLETVSTSGQTHYSKHMVQRCPCYWDTQKLWCSVITVGQVY